MFFPLQKDKKRGKIRLKDLKQREKGKERKKGVHICKKEKYLYKRNSVSKITTEEEMRLQLCTSFGETATRTHSKCFFTMLCKLRYIVLDSLDDR